MEKPRTILTTDMECDDMNSLIHLCLYFNDINLLGVIYTSSQYHFNGDGIHTLGEITPHYRCSGKEAYEGHIGYSHPGEDSKDMYSYRPMELGWIEKLWQNEYAEAYEYLIKHDDNYPTVDYLMSITKYGNIEFEGDVRFDSEGSNCIKKYLLDDDLSPLYLQSWGGVNTIVRALLSIYEEYSETDKWETIRNKVVTKTRILGLNKGVGQDNSFLDNDIPGKYPGIVILKSESLYGGYLASLNSQADCIDMFKAEWMKENIKFNHGSLMNKYILLGDGTYLENEPDRYQYGLYPVIDWGFDNVPAFHFDNYDFLGEGDSNTYIPLLNVGLRGLENWNYGTILGRLHSGDSKFIESYNNFTGKEGTPNYFVKAYHEEFAGRARWCHKEYDECDHAPVVKVNEDKIVKAGEMVELSGEVSNYDNYYWFVYNEGSNYSGKATNLSVFCPVDLNTKFVVPQDAESGDWFNLILVVKKGLFTRYGQVIIKVENN